MPAKCDWKCYGILNWLGLGYNYLPRHQKVTGYSLCGIWRQKLQGNKFQRNDIIIACQFTNIFAENYMIWCYKKWAIVNMYVIEYFRCGNYLLLSTCYIFILTRWFNKSQQLACHWYLILQLRWNVSSIRGQIWNEISSPGAFIYFENKSGLKLCIYTWKRFVHVGQHWFTFYHFYLLAVKKI